MNEPEANELVPDLVTQHRFDIGNTVGMKAREQYANGVLVEDLDDFDNWISATKAAIDEGAEVIFEAAFATDDVFVAVDVLQKAEDGWKLVEVKSSLSAKDYHINDLSIQKWVLSQCGINVTSCEVMHLNKECVYPNLEQLFTTSDVTEEVNELQPTVEGNVVALCETLDSSIPEIAPGEHCRSPFKCSFYDRCNKAKPLDHISNLYRVNPDRVRELGEEHDIESIHHITDEIKLTPVQQRQIKSIKTSELVLEEGLKNELSRIKYPIAFLDFETVMPAIPIWEGTKPYNAIPVQFSCHLVTEDGKVEHFEGLEVGDDDPRLSLAQKLLEACEPANTIIAYNAPFEKRCIEVIAGVNPEKKDRLLDLNFKFVDLLPIVRNNLYHPEFNCPERHLS